MKRYSQESYSKKRIYVYHQADGITRFLLIWVLHGSKSKIILLNRARGHTGKLYGIFPHMLIIFKIILLFVT